MGIERTSFFSAVRILAVQESPGRRSSVGIVQRDDDLEILCLLGAGRALTGGDAGGTQDRLVAYGRHMALEDLPGQCIDGDVGRLAVPHVDDVGLVYLDLGCDDGHVGDCHQRAARRVLNADDHRLAFANREVGDDAIEGRQRHRAVQHILVTPQRRRRLIDASGRGLRLGFCLYDRGLVLRDRRDGYIIGSLAGVVVRLGNQLVFVKRLAAFPVQFLLLERRLCAYQIGLCRLFRGRVRTQVRPRGGDGGLLRSDVRRRLHVLHRRREPRRASRDRPL